MSAVKRIILDVLKPHEPNALDFATTLAEQDDGYHVKLTVVEVDEKTESTVIEISGTNIQMDTISAAINNMGASLHSIDEVEVSGSTS